MDAAQRLTALTAAVEQITAQGRELAPEVPVDTCPGWTVGHLVGHLGLVHRWCTEATESTTRPTMGAEPDLRGRTLGEWYAASARALLDRLRACAADDFTQECWTFDPDDRTVGFWVRRQLHEATMHGVDLALAHGDEDVEIAPEVADDGIDELLHLFVPHRVADPARALPLPLTIRATDTGSVWSVEEHDGAVETARADEGEAVAEIQGTAAALYLALWGRRSRRALHVEGEAAPARGLLAQPLVP